MKRLRYIIYLLVFMLVKPGLAQVETTNTDLLLYNKNNLEEIAVISDRDIYLNGEHIQFHARCRLLSYPNQNWSQVLYIELIDANGESYAQKVVSLNQGIADGTVEIPVQIQTGNYFLKTYTKWLRNFHTSDYTYTPLRIINPENTVVRNLKPEFSTLKCEHSNTLQSNDLLKISLGKSNYGTREAVMLTIDKQDTPFNQFHYFVAVNKKGLKQHKVIKKTPLDAPAGAYPDKKFLPEISGIALGGVLMDKENTKTRSNEIVYLSSLNNISFFSAYKTNEKGRFYFNLPKGYSDIDLLVATNKASTSRIVLYEEYCKRETGIEYESFQLDSTALKLVNELKINKALAETYFDKKAQTESDTLSNFFYGEPNITYYPDEFVDLPRLEEFIFEIIPEVTVYYENHKPGLRTSNWNAFSASPFLLLIDNIIATDVEAFLDIKTKFIERIEIVDEAYLIGDLRFAGIIHLKSTKRDFAGLDLPVEYQTVNYDLFEKEKPATMTFQPKDCQRCPDLRTTLCWTDDIFMDNNSRAEVEFLTSDVEGDFEVNVYSISKADGRVYLNNKLFMVE